VSTVWLAIAVTAVVSAAIKAAGPLAAGGRALPAWAPAVIALLAPALLTSLVLVGVATDGARLVLDERVAGVAAGALALAARAPLVVAFVLAAATTALLRAI
jgi:hypothetical protein